MQTVGIVGLGLMGMPMAANLIKAGHPVTGFRRSDCSDFKALGGQPATSPRAVAEEAEIIICCIPDDAALEEVISGVQGIASGDCTGKIVVELSTLSLKVKARQAEALAAEGGLMLDGAISGMPAMVAAKTATYFASGDEAAFEAARPVLDAVTDKHFFMGAFGAASKTKLCANMLVAINITSIAETLSFAAKQGLDLGRLVEALREGGGTSLQFNVRAARMASGDWDEVLGATSTLAKDVHLIQKAASEVGCPTPILTSTTQILDDAIASGYADKDVAAVYASVAKAAGLPVPEKG